MNKQEAIEKLKEKSLFFEDDYVGVITVIELDDAQKIISQIEEPQKPVVPKFVAEWIGYCKFKGFTLLGALDPVSELGVGLVTSLTEELRKGKDWAQRNQETFTRAWLYGYEIEQEKFYTVEIPNPNGSGYSKIYLARNKDGKVELFTWSCYTSIEFANDWKQEDNAQLTESEIKQDFEWAWDAGFAEEVEEN